MKVTFHKPSSVLPNEHVNINLTPREAAALAWIFWRVGGTFDGPRGFTDALGKALTAYRKGSSSDWFSDPHGNAVNFRQDWPLFTRDAEVE
jgi:hypothetical protein